MCVIVYKPKDVPYPSEDIISACWDANSHGAGYMLSSDNGLDIVKGIMDKKIFMKEYRKFIFDGPVVFHFRIASHGAVDKYNTHPWRVNNKLAMVHNGIIDFCGTDRTVSDSKVFAEHLKHFDLSNNSHKIILEKAIGSNNKIVTLDNLGNVTILNEKSGSWQDGIWYSNTYWQYRNMKYDIIEFDNSDYIWNQRLGTYVLKPTKYYDA